MQTARLIDALRSVKPRCVYVAADGPRLGVRDESERCAAVLDLLATINWPCKLYLRVNEINQGSATSIPCAVDWFFDSVESGIVLEDDCIPSADFFAFCDAMLEKFANDARVAWINGSNINYTPPVSVRSDFSYCNYAVSWGWASWRRSWTSLFPPGPVRQRVPKGFSLDLKSIPIKGWLSRIFWRQNFKYAFAVPNWDFRFIYCMWQHGALAITPHANLITNVGFGIEAVHGGRRGDARANIPSGHLGACIVPPERTEVNFDLDSHFERIFYNINISNIIKLIIARRFPSVRKFYRKLLGKAN